MKILRRNLSLMLAVRYLNPLRTMFSIITLICLGGVALGVMVLIVVLSVMEGLQKEMEEKSLALQPHYTATLIDTTKGSTSAIYADACDWAGVEEDLRKHPKVHSAYALLEGMALTKLGHYTTTMSFRALESNNAAQIAPLKSMLKCGHFDLGMDNKCVISLKLGERLGIVYTTTNANNEKEYHLVPNVVMTFTPISGNIEKMAGFFQKLESELQTQNKDFLAILKALFYNGTASDKPVMVAQAQYYQTLAALLPYTDVLTEEEMQSFPYPILLDSASTQTEKLRRAEIDICNELLILLMNGREFAPEQQNAWYEQIAALEALEADKVNADELKELKSFVVPTDIEIVGAYQTPENMPGPDIYLPLNVTQEALSYSERDAVMGICVRLHDAHDPGDLEKVFYETLKKHEYTEATLPPEQEFADMPAVEDVDYSNMEEETLTPDTETEVATSTEPQQKAEETASVSAMAGMQWQVSSWKNDLEALYTLIAQERVMMSFVLSIINLIACFCIMAVMFTMSMQRKREIAVLQALGATPRKIVGIFAWQGVIIGFIGAILGMLLALLVLYFRLEIQDFMKQYLMDPFPMEAHGITLPAVYRLELFVKHAAIAFVMVVIASIIPAFFVSRQDPAKALRSN